VIRAALKAQPLGLMFVLARDKAEQVSDERVYPRNRMREGNRPQDAKASFTQILTQDANNADAHYGLGLALAAEQNPQAAIEEYKTAARLDPKSAGIDYQLGVSYVKLKMYDDAIAAFQKEQERSGDDYELETALAGTYQAKGMSQQAQEARNKADQLKDRETDR